jgi:type I restriction-modification system DNA methylase subunit
VERETALSRRARAPLLTLSVANLPEDELGSGYEYLIKKFADDSGHTAQEFYTNRTLVHLMTQMLDPQPGESVYDPTCGTGGTGPISRR